MGLRSVINAFRKSERGATAVEFVLLLPVMMVLFAAIVEGTRIYWNYQSAVSGVRDAVRIVARQTNSDICPGAAGPYVGPINTTAIVGNTMRDEQNLFPTGVTLTTVQTFVDCINTAGLRNPVTAVARVQATVRIALPFGRLFEFFGTRENPFMESTITDQSRIYGI